MDNQNTWTSFLTRGRELCDSEFISSITKIKFLPVLMGTIVLWAQIIFAFWIALKLPLVFIVLSFVIICACQQAMLLWVHEGSHYNLFTKHYLNDLWTDLFFSTPLGMTVEKYRSHHLSHHAHLATPQDEERWEFTINIKGRNLTRLILNCLTGIYGIKLAMLYSKGFNTKNKFQVSRLLLSLIWNIFLFGICFLSDRWYLYFILWLLPLFTVTVCLNILRTTSEHQPIEFKGFVENNSSIPEMVRTTIPTWWQKWFMYQANFNYHVEHHIFPNIPFYNLPKVHKHLIKKNFYNMFPECLQKSCTEALFKLSKTNILNKTKINQENKALV